MVSVLMQNYDKILDTQWNRIGNIIGSEELEKK